LRKITAKHDESSASRIEARVREIVGGGELLDASRGKRGEGMGVWLGFIGGRLWRGRKGSVQRLRGFPCRCGGGCDLPFGVAPLPGKERKETGEERKGKTTDMRVADRRGRQRSEREGKSACGAA